MWEALAQQGQGSAMVGAGQGGGGGGLWSKAAWLQISDAVFYLYDVEESMGVPFLFGKRA